MKLILKIILVLTIILILPISIYYGLRILHTGYTYEYLNQSLVVTLPNGVWFEINETEDLVNNTELIFENDTIDVTNEGINFGLLYPTYILTMDNDTASKTRTVKRVGNVMEVENNIEFNTNEFQTYTTRIYFSKHGEFKNNICTEGRCSVKISSEQGTLSYDKEQAIIDIEYDIKDSKINDLIQLEISCL